MRRKIISILITVMLIFTLMPATAFAATPQSWAAGVLGANITGNLTADGTLTLSGTGPMNDFTGAGTPFKTLGVTSVVIGSGITSIGAYTFYGCSSLTNITIPNSVTTISGYTFSYCSSLTNITIPNSVTSIGEGTFFGCTGLTNITIPNSVTTIFRNVFQNCTGLTNITIPNSVTSIGNAVFSGCSSLTNITIPNSVTSISEYTFENCTGLTNITIPNSVTGIGTYAFENCASLTNITIPDSVTSIGDYAFSRCTSLINITIPDSVTGIGMATFNNCTKLTNITIPDSVTKIGNLAFYGCTSLTNITIPNSITSIGVSAFRNCSSLKTIINKAAINQTIGTNAFNTTATGDKTVSAYLTNTNFITVMNTSGYTITDLSAVASISVTTTPTKTSYIEAQNFNPAGMVVTATLNDSTTKVVSGYTITNGDNLTIDRTSVMISYTEGGTFTATTPIFVVAKQVESVSVSEDPTDVFFIAGQGLSILGGKVLIVYTNGSSEEVALDPGMLSGYKLASTGNKTLTVNVGSATATLSVYVEAVQTENQMSALDGSSAFELYGYIEPIDIAATATLSTYLAIDPNITGAAAFISPTLTVRNDCNAPIEVFVISFKAAGTSPKVVGKDDKHWNHLNSEETLKYIALGLSGGNISDKYWFPEESSQLPELVGRMNTGESNQFTVEGLFGRAWPEQKALKYQLVMKIGLKS